VFDLADAVVLLLERYNDESIINVGCGEDITIKELGEIVMAVTGYRGRLEFDANTSDGTPRKLLDVSKITALGWRPQISLRSGIEQVYAWFRANANSLRL
jgi:GDP-L-fucose synthase